MKPTNDFTDTGTYVQHDTMPMRPYAATFAHKGTHTIVKCDGISPTHAHARAWIKHMDSPVFKNDKDGWSLINLWSVRA